MTKLILGVMTALLLAACSDMGSVAPAAQSSAATSGVGHPDPSYPGPRAY
jgi:hypothetical protein